MDEKTITLIIVATAALMYVWILATIPFRAKKALSDTGKLLLPLKNGMPLKVIFLFILAALIIAVIPMRNFALYLQVIFALAALVASRMGAQEAAGIGRAGIYENTIIFGTYVVPFDDILAIPTLAYEDDPDTVNVDKTTIEIIRKSTAATVILIFDDEEKRNEAVQVILKIRPDLKQENEE